MSAVCAQRCIRGGRRVCAERRLRCSQCASAPVDLGLDYLCGTCLIISLSLKRLIRLTDRYPTSTYAKPGNNIKSPTGNGIYRIKEGQMPHARDAINLRDAAWDKVTESAIVRCWLKSKCLALAHEHTLRALLSTNK
eukprot:IDg5570t1